MLFRLSPIFAGCKDAKKDPDEIGIADVGIVNFYSPQKKKIKISSS